MLAHYPEAIDDGPYLCELPPIQVVSCIKFEDENIINFRAHPYTTVYAKE